MWRFLFSALLTLLLFSCASVSKKDMNEAKAFFEAGTSDLVRGDATAALEKLLSAAKLNPEDPYIQNNLALSYQLKGIFERAEFHFKRALEIKADFPDAQNNLGTLYLKLKRWDDSIKYCKLAIENPLYRTPEKAYSAMGRAYYFMKDYKKAIEYQKKAVKIDKQFCFAYTSLGQAQMKLTRYDDAAQSLERALKICSTFDAAHYVLGLNYMRASKWDLARKQFNVLIRKFPSSRYSAKAKGYIKQLTR